METKMHAGNDDDGFVARLTAWDDERAAGSAADPAELQETERFVAAAHLVQRLESMWPREKAAPAPALPAGFSRFRIARVLGTGGFGIVYLAEDSRLKRQVALKVPRPEALIDPCWRERFMREAQAVAQLDHPNIVPIFDSGEVGSWCFLVSAYCSEGNLADWLRTQETLLPFKTAAHLIATLAQAVQHAHERGILHRDLKPANILLTPAPEPAGTPEFPFVPHISDFGLAKIVQQVEGAESVATLTRSTAVLGTPAYMAPEQARGKGDAVGTAADVYALGVLLYEILTGQPPFRGASHLETLQQIAVQDPVAPGQRRPDVPRDLEAICLKCLEKAPAARYASAADLAADLMRYLADRPTVARPLGLLGRTVKSVRRHPALSSLSALACAAMLFVVGGLVWRSHELESHNADLKAAADRETELANKARKAQTLAEERERRVRLQSYATNLAMADSFHRDNRRELARDLLLRQVPATGERDDRDFAWRYLWHSGETFITRNKQQIAAMVLGFTPDGKRLLVGDYVTRLACFDVANRTLVWERRVDSDLPYPLRWQFSPTAERVAIFSVNAQKTKLAIFDAASNRRLYDRVIDARSIPTFPTSSFSSNGARLAFCDDEVPENRKVSLIDITSGKKITLLEITGYRPVALAFSPDGSRLAVVSEVVVAAPDRPACLLAFHSFATGETTHTPVGDGFRDPLTLLWSPDGKALACSSFTHNVILWNAESPRQPKVLPLKTLSPGGLAFSTDGKYLAAVDSSAKRESQTVRTFRADDGRENPATYAAKAVVHCVAWSPTEDLLAIAGADNEIHLWNPLPAPPHRILPGHQPAETWAVAFAPDGKTLASTGDDWMLRLWDPYTGEALDSREGHASLVPCVAYSPDGRWIATGSYDKEIVLRSAKKPQQEVHRFKHTHRIFRVAFSADCKLLASCSRDTSDVTVNLWNTDTGNHAGVLEGHKNVVRCLAFAPTGNVLASASNDATVCLWDSITKKLLRTLPHRGQVHSLAFSPDGRTLAAGELSGAITFWNLADGQAITTLQHHTECVRSLAYSPDGRTLASGSQDKTVRLWNPVVYQELLAFPPLSHEVNSVAFSPDSDYLAAGLHNGGIALWHGPRLRP